MLERAPALAVADMAVGVPLAWRRALYAVLCLSTIAGLMVLTSRVLPPRDIPSTLVLIFFVIAIPWSVVGFWNAVIGFIIMRFARDPVAVVNPLAGTIRGNEPILASTALLFCVKDEDAQRIVRNLEPNLEDFVRLGVGDRFHVYILSDTRDDTIAAEEVALCDALAAKWRGKVEMTYRRRPINTEFKAGNIREFCERWGNNHDFMIALDADSFMPATSILRIVRIMQANPKLGILQTLVVGLPSISPFARIFQFGMRLSMRSYTIGAQWWMGDCGPYWGHNAIIRIKPFTAHCELPKLNRGGALGDPILSHDQIEAAQMARAGYDVRVIPEDGTSFEENPPDLVEFTRRDLRWCQGNMQYIWLLNMPGLRRVGRFQLFFAVLMYVGSPVWIALLALGAAVVVMRAGEADTVRTPLGLALFVIVMVMVLAPKIATVLDVMTRKHLRQQFGGTFRFLCGLLTETVFFLLISPIMAVGHTIFLIGLFFGRSGGWPRQSRDSIGLPWRLAAKLLWPQTLLGLLVLGVTLWVSPRDIAFALLCATGLVLAIPFAVVTASPALGRFFVRIGLDSVPEEISPPPEVLPLKIPAIELTLSEPKRRPA